MQIIPSDQEILKADRVRRGYVKCRLVHKDGGSFVLPELLLTRSAERRFYIPQFFYPNMLMWFGDVAKSDLCTIVLGMDEVIDVKILFRRSQMVKVCADGAFIYKCTYSLLRGGGLPDAHGSWRRCGETFELALYHHTDASAAESILASGELRSSQWNIQGTQKLSNISYVYFTSLPRIANDSDLRRVAMSPNGVACFLSTNAPIKTDNVVTLDVYKRTCNGLDTPMKFWVNAELGRVDKRDSHWRSAVIQACICYGDQLAPRPDERRRMVAV